MFSLFYPKKICVDVYNVKTFEYFRRKVKCKGFVITLNKKRLLLHSSSINKNK